MFLSLLLQITQSNPHDSIFMRFPLSDALAQFRFLHTLLFVHGTWCNDRQQKLVRYLYFKSRLSVCTTMLSLLFLFIRQRKVDHCTFSIIECHSITAWANSLILFLFGIVSRFSAQTFFDDFTDLGYK
jgi:hypothetical protein